MAWYRSATYPIILAILISLVIYANFFYPGTIADQATSKLMDWVTIIVTLMVYAGLLNVVRFGLRDIRKKTPGRWQLAAFQLCLMAVMLLSGFVEGKGSTGRGVQSVINWLYNNYYQYGAVGQSALTGLWVVTASYRALRARTVEATLFLFGGIVVLFSSAPIGAALWMGFPIIGNWILNVPYFALMKALTLGVGIGLFAYGVRYYLGKERGALGVVE